jgi:hypothetical protein
MKGVLPRLPRLGSYRISWTCRRRNVGFVDFFLALFPFASLLLGHRGHSTNACSSLVLCPELWHYVCFCTNVAVTNVFVSLMKLLATCLVGVLSSRYLQRGRRDFPLPFFWAATKHRLVIFEYLIWLSLLHISKEILTGCLIPFGRKTMTTCIDTTSH